VVFGHGRQQPQLSLWRKPDRATGHDADVDNARFNDRYAPGSTSAPPYQVFEDMRALGYPANVAVSYDIRFHRYLRLGESARHFTSVVNISDRKATRLGTGYFVTERVEYLTLDETVFADALITYFQYQAAAAAALLLLLLLARGILRT